PARDRRVADEEADLAAVLELVGAQALATDEGPRAVANDGPHVQPKPRPSNLDLLAELLGAADHADHDPPLHPLPPWPQPDPLLHALLQELDHAPVLDLEVVDGQLLARPLDERGEPFARTLGAHDEVRARRRIGLSRAVRLEEVRRVLHGAAVARGDREAAALVDVELGEVEAEE